MTGAELLRATVNFWATDAAATGLIFTPFAGGGSEAQGDGDGQVIYAHALGLIVAGGRGPLFWLIADGSWFIIYFAGDSRPRPGRFPLLL